MKLAVSNIAWPREEASAAAEALVACGVTGLEVAPTLLWPDPLAATPAEVRAARQWWAERGLTIVAAQSLLFGRPDLVIFGSADARQATRAYLARVAGLCGEVGATRLVFGSPKNRLVGAMPRPEADQIALEFFAGVADDCAAAGVQLVLEPNPPQYGADFAVNAAEALDLVRRIDRPGLGLHLDTGCMTLAGDAVPATLASAADSLRHFHVSEPYLAVPCTDAVDHVGFAAALARIGYQGWVSIEMRAATPFTADGLRSTIESVRAIYGR